MTEFKTVRDSRTAEPEAIDTTSSETTVYERRNIRQESRVEEVSGEIVTITEWVYEQREYTCEEWSQEQAVKRALAGLSSEDVAKYKAALEVLGVDTTEETT